MERKKRRVWFIEDHARDRWVIRWKDWGDRTRQKDANTQTRAGAAREAKQIERKINSQRGDLSWDDFIRRFDATYLSCVSSRHRDKCLAM